MFLKTGFKRFLSILLLLILTGISTLITGCGSQIPPAAVVEEAISQPTSVPVMSIADLAELAGPSIAYIEASDDDNPEFYWFGSGFVVDSEGIIVTNFHVMEGATRASIEIDGVIYEDVSVIAANPDWDLALLKIDTSGLQPLSLARGQGEVRLGEEVVAMGNPEGFKKTVSDGIVSSVYRRLDGFDFDHIQTTAPISKGSSGGPLLNMQGEVIGINTLTYMTGQNLNFAVPIDLLHELLGNRGESLALAEVFSYGTEAANIYYEHRDGELAVVVSWTGNADLDLEIWSSDFEYIGSASVIGDSPDITSGGQGEEWFAFTRYTTDAESEFIDYSQDTYIVSLYYYGPEPAGDSNPVEATVTVYSPAGKIETTISGELLYEPPYDEWFVLFVDSKAGSSKLANFYLDAPMLALLEWDNEADLDLAVWSEDYENYFFPGDFDYGYDITDGNVGLEVFAFRSFENDGEVYDFSEGLYEVGAFSLQEDLPVTEATITLLFDNLNYYKYSHRFDADPSGNYLWLPVYNLDPQSGDFFENKNNNGRLYIDTQY